MRARAALALSVAFVFAVMSCHANPDINGASVPTVGSATDVPTCEQVCARLKALCGYAPVDCFSPDEDGGDYCDTVLADDSVKICIGFGADDGDGGTIPTTSCELAWDCVANAPTDTGDDASTDDSGDQADDSGDDSGDDGGSDAGGD